MRSRSCDSLCRAKHGQTLCENRGRLIELSWSKFSSHQAEQQVGQFFIFESLRTAYF